MPKSYLKVIDSICEINGLMMNCIANACIDFGIQLQC